MAAMAAILDFRSEQFWLFNVQVIPMLPTKFQDNWPFGSGEEAKIDLQDGGPGGQLGFPL